MAGRHRGRRAREKEEKTAPEWLISAQENVL